MPFVKGKSGNPSGRSKVDLELQALAQGYGSEAVHKLGELMRGGDPRVAAQAAVALLDRGFGKPKQAVDVAAEVNATVTQGLGPIYGLHAPPEA